MLNPVVGRSLTKSHICVAVSGRVGYLSGVLYPLRCRETISLRGPVFHRSHGHNLVRPGRQSEVNYGYVSKICR